MRNVRWIVGGLIFLATAINYIDRQSIGLLKTTLQGQFAWSEVDYANIVFAFQLAYTIGLVAVGGVLDRLGSRLGFATAIAAWSLAAIGHAAAPAVGAHVAGVFAMAGLGYSTSVAGFLTMRFLLGIGEAGLYPAGMKVVAEWFPKAERAIASGALNAGATVGALIAPLLVPWITVAYGWAAAFVITGALGFVWLAVWVAFYRTPESHPWVSPEELAHIRREDDAPDIPVAWLRVLPLRQTWAFGFGKFFTDPVWWLYLFWIPDFLSRRFHLTLAASGAPIATIYLIASAGAMTGGWLSSMLLARGWPLNRARKTAMFVMSFAVLPIAFVPLVSHLWTAVLIVGVAAGAHQGWSANIFALTADVMPRTAVGSVMGVGGAIGAIGGMLVAEVTGYVLEATHSYVPIFAAASGAYFVGLLVVHAFNPRLERAKL